MEAKCPNCNAVFTVPNAGNFNCTCCGNTFSATSFPEESQTTTQSYCANAENNVGSKDLRTCDNCREVIGAIEKAYSYGANIVCGMCLQKLNKMNAEASSSNQAPPPFTSDGNVMPKSAAHKVAATNKISVILWTSLLVWTGIILILIIGAIAFYEQGAQTRSSMEERYVAATGLDPERTAGGCWFCMLSFVWLMVATPLFISAVTVSFRRKTQ